MVAVTTAVPAAVVFKTLVPAAMVAPVVPAVLTVHVMVLLVALDGATVPVRVRGVPTPPVVGMPVIPVTPTHSCG